MKTTLSILGSVAALVFSGCSYITPPLEKPIIEDHSHDGRVTTFATIPSRRVVFLTEHQKESGKIILCAEPAADVSDNIASSLAQAVTAKGPTTGKKSAAEVAASISKTLATTAQHLFKRTQGLQLYRDGMYNLCQARMNGIIDDETFKTQADTLLEKSVILIQAEIPYLSNTQPTNVPGPAPSTATAGTTGNGNTNTNIGNTGGGN